MRDARELAQPIKMKDDSTHCTSDTFSISSIEGSSNNEDGDQHGGPCSSSTGDCDTIAGQTFGGETISFDFQEPTPTRPHKPERSEIQAKLASKEQAWVFRSKCLATFVLFIAATVMATKTYWLISEGERADFEAQVSFIFTINGFGLSGHPMLAPFGFF